MRGHKVRPSASSRPARKASSPSGRSVRSWRRNGRRHGNEMHVVRHQAICPNLYLPPGTLSRHQVQVCSIVLFAKKCLLPPVAPLCKVVGTPGAITRAILAMPLSYYIRNIVLKPINIVDALLRYFIPEIHQQRSQYNIVKPVINQYLASQVIFNRNQDFSNIALHEFKGTPYLIQVSPK